MMSQRVHLEICSSYLMSDPNDLFIHNLRY